MLLHKVRDRTLAEAATNALPPGESTRAELEALLKQYPFEPIEVSLIASDEDGMFYWVIIPFDEDDLADDDVTACFADIPHLVQHFRVTGDMNKVFWDFEQSQLAEINKARTLLLGA